MNGSDGGGEHWAIIASLIETGGRMRVDAAVDIKVLKQVVEAREGR